MSNTHLTKLEMMHNLISEIINSDLLDDENLDKAYQIYDLSTIIDNCEINGELNSDEHLVLIWLVDGYHWNYAPMEDMIKGLINSDAEWVGEYILEARNKLSYAELLRVVYIFKRYVIKEESDGTIK